MASDPGRVGPFERWGHLVYRRRRWVLAAAGVFLAFAATWGTGVFGSLISSGFETPGSESARALAQAEDTVGRDAADVVVLYRDGGRSVDDPRFRDAIQRHLADLPPSLVKSTTTWWSTNGTADALVSHDRTQTYAVLHLVGNDDDALMDAYDALEPRLRDAPPGLTVQLGGDEAISSDITNQVSEDIGRAEQLSLPVGEDAKPAATTVIVETKAPAANGNGVNLQGTWAQESDAPPCHECGTIMVRSGACYKCLNCAATSGCS